jgi:hypothetical protein
VDPAGAEFWEGKKASFLEPVCKILLTRRAREYQPQDKKISSVLVRELLPGDPVYVLGNVEVNPEAPRDAADSERLVVRACTEPVKPSLFNFLFFNSQRFLKSRDYRYVFLVSDAYEYKLKDLLHQGIYSILIPGAIWTGGSALQLAIALALR